MRLQTLQRQSLRHHRGASLAVMLGVAVGAATLTGALLVGDSVRGSLRENALKRLFGVDSALTSGRFIRQELAADIAGDAEFASRRPAVAPVIIAQGVATHADRRTRASQIQVLGVDPRFWSLNSNEAHDPPANFVNRSVILNEPLASELSAVVGDDIVVRIGRADAISTETLLGRRDQVVAAMRLTVRAVVADEGPGAFDLQPSPRTPRTAFVPLSALQNAMAQPQRVNGILVAGRGRFDNDPSADIPSRLLKKHLTLTDVGLRLRAREELGYISLESDRFLLEPPVESAARQTAKELPAPVTSIQTYLANSISIDRGGSSAKDVPVADTGRRPPSTGIPYSTVAALDSIAPGMAPLERHDGSSLTSVAPGTILLSDWAASDLQAREGDRIKISYYTVDLFGEIEERSASFALAGVVKLSGGAADPGFTPEYPGVTDAENMADWDPPFPVDLNRVRDKDETYWKDHRTTPKAFLSLDDAKRIWAEDAERFGSLTALRFAAPRGCDVETLRSTIEEKLLSQLDPSTLDLSFKTVRQEAIASGAGSTDFGGLFIGFSFFLIVSAAMLVALLFRLGVERRSSEIGLMLAVGFAPRRVTRMLTSEGLYLAVPGAILGLVGAGAYAWAMLAGLRSWWSAATNAPFLQLHVSATSLSIGGAAGVAVAALAIVWSIRGLSRRSPIQLIGGGADTLPDPSDATSRRSFAFACFFAAAAVTMIVLVSAGDSMPKSLAFFGSGALALIALLALAAHWLRSSTKRRAVKPGFSAVARLGLRNASRNPGRSLTVISLIASAVFIVVALQALRIEDAPDTRARESGTGGYSLLAESSLPLPFDINSEFGRDQLGVGTDPVDLLRDVTIVPLRLRQGEETSCLNLYKPVEPRIVGATSAFIERAGFTFSSTLASSQAEQANPWRLLERTFDDGAIPVIGDEAAVVWQLHSGLGKDFLVSDERGRRVALRFVALLKGSVLQSELIVPGSRFTEMFPTNNGFSFFLVDAPEAQIEQVGAELEKSLERFGFDITSAAVRLAQYVAVQNTYLSTFQALGGLGLLLGSVGLSIVLLRNVWERRKELALMRALGFSTRGLGAMVLAENTALVTVGLAAGFLSAFLAILPRILDGSTPLPWASMVLLLVSVFVVSFLSGAIALAPTLKTPLLPALRSE